ncbi:hypothetical protein K440DRAFT_633097 [Wilcoxina mikolae CBS 423.85]|nr:hypothetical protein K440DRAFT_633097 [Wilcoxina mikolae CBS 423.85]
MPTEIPGFYYDTEKGKYFRVLPHHAAPTSSFYSSSSVEQQQREKQRNEELQHEATHRLKRKRRAPLKSNPYVRATLYRELSGVVSSTEHAVDTQQVYAQGLRRRQVFETDPGVKISAFASDTTAGKTSVVIGSSVGDVRRVRGCFLVYRMEIDFVQNLTDARE